MKKFYEDQDINDIIEAEEDAFFKGGVGSGIKGHTGTKVDMNMTNRNAPNPNSRSEVIARNNFKDKLKQIKENNKKTGT